MVSRFIGHRSYLCLLGMHKWLDIEAPVHSSATFVVKDVSVYQRLTMLSRNFLTPAVNLLCIGIIIGAIWAGSALGNCWQWDPKEVWALITLLLYSIPLHRNDKGALKTARHYHIFMLAAYLALLMTYFGVNYFLGEMHAF